MVLQERGSLRGACVIPGQAVARTSHLVQLPRSPHLLTFVPRFKPCLLQEYGTNSSFSRVTASECLKLLLCLQVKTSPSLFILHLFNKYLIEFFNCFI